jgi:uncharacterized membrane protein YgaE (UPF0421/DUF939 family)
MQNEKNSERDYTSLGMLLGIAVGAGIGVIAFALTGQALYLSITGVGLVIGLILGRGLDNARA